MDVLGYIVERIELTDVSCTVHIFPHFPIDLEGELSLEIFGLFAVRGIEPTTDSSCDITICSELRHTRPKLMSSTTRPRFCEARY